MRGRTVVIIIVVLLLVFAPKVLTGMIDSTGGAAKASVCGSVR